MKNEFQAKGEKMSLYTEKANNLANEFELCEITQIPRSLNKEADALAKLATQGLTSEHIPVIQVQQSSIAEGNPIFQIQSTKSWQTPFRLFSHRTEQKRLI